MTGKTHIALGTALGIAAGITQIPDYLSGGLLFFGCTIGSIAPDIDSKASRISQNMKVTSFIMRQLGHRGIVHTPFMLLILSGIILGISIWAKLPFTFLFGFIIGFLTHLIQDSFTRAGIKWLLPFSQKKLALTKTKTGSFTEVIISLALFFPITAIIWTVFGYIPKFLL